MTWMAKMTYCRKRQHHGEMTGHAILAYPAGAARMATAIRHFAALAVRSVAMAQEQLPLAGTEQLCRRPGVRSGVGQAPSSRRAGRAGETDRSLVLRLEEDFIFYLRRVARHRAVAHISAMSSRAAAFRHSLSLADGL